MSIMKLPNDAIFVPFGQSQFLLTIDKNLEQYFSEADSSFWFKFTPSLKVEGPPHHVHGGFLASLMDEAMGGSVWLNGFTAVTHKLQMDYRKPVPLDRTHTVRSVVADKQRRRLITESELTDEDGTVLTRATADFFIIDITKLGKVPVEYSMFRRFHELRGQSMSVEKVIDQLTKELEKSAG